MASDRPIGTDLLLAAQDLAARKRSSKRTTTCRAYACAAVTSEGKDFCFDHVLLHPYASAVRVTLARLRLLGERDVESERRARMLAARAARRAGVSPTV